MDGLGLASAGRALNNVRTQRGGNTGCAAYLQERSGAQAGMVEYCETRAQRVPPPPSLSSFRALFSRRLSSFPLFHPHPLPLPLPRRLASFSHCSSLPPHVPAPYVRNEPRVIHHNRFTCTSAVRTFTALVSAARCPDDSNGAVFIAK